MTELDEDTRLKLIGLRALAQDLWRQISALEMAAARLVGESSDPWAAAHSSDFLAGDDPQSPDELWRRTAEFRETAK